ncbi:hypothetical protein GALMADRAFT_76606 [Galerina marginata CBS 339.88]|uniref:BTB domain-containing protein n=1 Tax=Galerina marginata (strain CBS 339.88) TaxID=685588 RepID=A0A067SG96_GALM3|nr:hypothetical protein GALMADRAFT_76606 [Galerina marginata CBS 339.88]
MLDSIPPEKPAQVEGLWFEDGNLILRAENSLFRIYSGLLAARSSVFRDMLSFPPPYEGNPTMDGCSIVTVYDSARDMGYFLQAIFDSSFFEPAPTPTELPIVESVLRLSLKYDVQYLRKRALQHLLTTFPMTLKAWQQRDDLRTIPPVDNTPFAAFRLAREFDLVWLLPSIVYCMSSHPFEKTLDHATWEDEQIDLSWADKRMCIIGRQKIVLTQSRQAITMMKAASAEVDGCTGDSCGSTRQRCADILSGWDMAGILDYFEDNSDVYYCDLCSTCRIAFKQSSDSACQAMWNDLPGMFSLPEWAALEEERQKSFD